MLRLGSPARGPRKALQKGGLGGPGCYPPPSSSRLLVPRFAGREPEEEARLLKNRDASCKVWSTLFSGRPDGLLASGLPGQPRSPQLPVALGALREALASARSPCSTALGSLSFGFRVPMKRLTHESTQPPDSKQHPMILSPEEKVQSPIPTFPTLGATTVQRAQASGAQRSDSLVICG